MSTANSAAAWRLQLTLFNKPGFVEAEIEEDFIKAGNTNWFTAMHYMPLEGDRLNLQSGWITYAGCQDKDHAVEIHRLGVREKGRMVIKASVKDEANQFLGKLGITQQALGFESDDSVDRIATELKKEFEDRYPRRQHHA